MMEDQENQIWGYQYQKGPEILDKEHSQREKISEFQESSHLRIHLDKLQMGTSGSTSQAVFFQLVQLFGQLGLCKCTIKYVTTEVESIQLIIAWHDLSLYHEIIMENLHLGNTKYDSSSHSNCWETNY